MWKPSRALDSQAIYENGDYTVNIKRLVDISAIEVPCTRWSFYPSGYNICAPLPMDELQGLHIIIEMRNRCK